MGNIMKQDQDRMPQYKKGGVVKKTGPAVVHKGEFVVPSKVAKKHGLTGEKAHKILADGSVKGHPLTKKQRGFFGAVFSASIPEGRKKAAKSMLSKRG